MHDFEYLRPATLADALQRLREDPDARPMAGGQTLIPVLKQRLSQPTAIVDLADLGLSGVRVEGETVVIGAMTTHRAISEHPEVQRRIPGLARLASWIGDNQVRARGTIGGSLANNDPGACHPAAALALGARIKTDRRVIAADDYFQGLYTTALEPGELLLSVAVDTPDRSSYSKFRHPASRFAMVGVFVARGPAGVRVAVTGAAQGGVFRHREMEAALAARWSANALDEIETPSDDMNTDIHGTAVYRAHLVGVVAKRAVTES